MPSNTIRVRIMIISDTHEHCLDGTTMPEAEILIHTGDLTNFGDLSSLETSIKMLGTIPAELKLVIPGNHDISLSPVPLIENMSPSQYAAYHASALEIMTGPLAKEAGITYLEEGTHTFTLENGARFTVYASPYTPGTGGWTFQYEAHEDRFNTPSQSGPSSTSIATNPIPSSGIDIIMTHGPPFSILDRVGGQSLGCPHLLRAVSRARPLLHCFGHIHEGHGAHIVDWREDGSVKNPENATPLETEQVNEWPGANEWEIARGKQTLMVNAAIMRNTSRGMRPDLKPFVVVLNLPRW